MAARRKASSPQQAQNKKQSDVIAKSSNAKSSSAADGAVTTTTPMTSTNKNNALADAHLPPLGLVAATLLCSGFLLVLALRDFCTTGRNLLGNVDEAFLVRRQSIHKIERQRRRFFLTLLFLFFILLFGQYISSTQNPRIGTTIHKVGNPPKGAFLP